MGGGEHVTGRMPRVLVTGSEVPAGLAALRGLSAAGFEPWAAVVGRGAAGARSRACGGIVQVPDPRSEADAFVRALADAASRLKVAAVLPGTEAALLALAGRSDAFPASVAVGNAPEAALRRATDKTALALLALRAGLDTPPTRIVVAGGTLATEYDLSFPAVVKPLRSELTTADGGLRRFEAHRVESRAELERALRDLPDEVGLVQPYIDGRLISVNGVAWKGSVEGMHQHVVYRVWPERCGHLAYAETIPLGEEREHAVGAFMRELDWSGVFNLQLIEHEGRQYVIDLNPRFYHSLGLAVAAGVNLPAIWTSLLLDLPFDPGRCRFGVRFRDEKDDPRAIWRELRRGQATALLGLLPRRDTAHSLFSIRDPGPALSLFGAGAAKLRRKDAQTPPEPPSSRAASRRERIPV
jgi:predicted ATP-grasp superfamily ATP-dependent carboligase